jgi:hypothetical protein
MRYRLFPLVACVLASACGGDGSNGAGEAAAGGVSFAVSSVPLDQTEVWAGERPPGPATGWATHGGVQFFVRAPKQTVRQPARLTFTISAELFDSETAGRVDQLGVFTRTGCFLPRVPDRIVRVRDAPSPTLALPRASSSRTGTAGSWFLPRTPRPSNRRHRRLRRSASQETSLMPIQTGVNRT